MSALAAFASKVASFVRVEVKASKPADDTTTLRPSVAMSASMSFVMVGAGLGLDTVHPDWAFDVGVIAPIEAPNTAVTTSTRLMIDPPNWSEFRMCGFSQVTAR